MRTTLWTAVLFLAGCAGDVSGLDGGTGGGTGTLENPQQPDAGVDAGVVDRWLHTEGNRILKADGTRWHGRGANLHDTRGCDACSWNTPDVGEVKRRMDLLVDDWKANFIRLDLESYASSGGRVSWQPWQQDATYRAHIKDIVAHARTKPGLYVMLSLWVDPSFSPEGWPTANTVDTWRAIAAEFKDEPHVLFGLVNEPENNFDGAQDAQVWAAMNSAVQAIRDAEGAGPKHLVAVQGTGGWARHLGYYVTHPITAGGGQNVVYETHVYDAASEFAARFEMPALTLPVIIGEYGPAQGYMTEADCTALITRARAAEVPHLAWTFHQRCPPNLIQDLAGGCGVGMPLQPTSWGTLLRDALAQPW